MNPAPRARRSSAQSAMRTGAPRRGRGLVLALAALVASLLGLGTLALRRNESRQARQGADGVRLAQRRAGEEIPQAGAAPEAPPRTPESTMPSSPTPLPMPGAQHEQAPAPRYILGDSPPPRPAPGHLFVDTQPASSVWIDDEAKGKTPLDVQVGAGPKVLRLEAAGFRPVRESFEAGPGVVIRRALVPLGASR